MHTNLFCRHRQENLELKILVKESSMNTLELEKELEELEEELEYTIQENKSTLVNL